MHNNLATTTQNIYQGYDTTSESDYNMSDHYQSDHYESEQPDSGYYTSTNTSLPLSQTLYYPDDQTSENQQDAHLSQYLDGYELEPDLIQVRKNNFGPYREYNTYLYSRDTSNDIFENLNLN